MFQLGGQVEWALHCAVVLAAARSKDRAVSGATLAELHGVPAPYLAKALQALSRAGIIESEPGRNGGYRLAREASQITFLDIIESLQGDTPMFRCTEIRRNLPVRPPHETPVCAIAATMYQAEAAWRAELAKTSLVDILDQLTPPLSTSSNQHTERAF